MTISSQQTSEVYATNGVTVAFTIPFYWILDSHIIVTWTNGGPIIPLGLGTDYTLAGAGSLGGGTLTTVTPYAAGTLTVRRLVPLLQLYDYTAHGTIPAETVEQNYDYLMMAIQQLSYDISALGSGSPISFANVGASGVSSYAGMSGSTAQFKKIVGASGITASETATQITLTGSGAGVDLAANYPWTGLHTHTKQAARAAPSWIIKSLQGASDIVDSSILLASDYVAMMDLRKRTDVSVEAPVDASWGGNFALYAQHAISGTAGVNGTLTGGIRSQVETAQVHGAGAVNDCVSGYFGLYNNGTDVGGFGIHVDAYHVGAASSSGHTTYGLSSEVFKNITNGVAVGVLTRSLGSQMLDYGIVVAGTQLRRGLQLGTPTYLNGGIAGATGFQSVFYVGIDLTWGQYFEQAIAIPRNTPIGFSGVNASQTTAQDRTCEMSWSSGTGNLQVLSGGAFKFGVNMTTGNLFGPGTNEQLSCWDTTANWVLSFTTTNKVSSTSNGGTITAGVATALNANQLNTFMVIKAGGTFLKIPCFPA